MDCLDTDTSGKPVFPRFKWVLVTVGFSIVTITIWLGLVLFFVSMWSVREFGPITVPQAQMNLAGGAESAPEIARAGWIIGLIVPTVVAAVIVLLACFSLRGPGRRRARGPIIVPVLLSAALVLPLGMASSNYAFDWTSWLKPKPTDVDIAAHYVDPDLISPLPMDRNLVLIYLESMDDAFGDSALLGENALEELQEQTNLWAKLDRYTQIPISGGWTIAAMVASQCGFPLRADETVPLHNDERDKDVPYILPGATCMGDILKEAGYSTVYMGGASAGFAGKGSFLTTHGFDRVLNLEDWQARGETEISDWGLSDRRLFQLAEEELTSLRDANEPFALALLTLDNHRPIHEYDYCPRGPDEDETVVAVTCQGAIVADFVRFLDEQQFLEDTVVVIIADHQMLESYEVTGYREKLPSGQSNPVPLFNRFYSPYGEIVFNRDHATQFDVFPTVLELLGGKFRNGQAGLGLSLVTPANAEGFPGTLADMTNPQLERLLDSASTDFYEQMWSVPQNNG